MDAEVPGPDNTKLVAIGDMEMLDLATLDTVGFIGLGPKDDQQFVLSHQQLLSMKRCHRCRRVSFFETGLI